jgi:5,6-dimethylbenzimidazole synthase
VLIAAHHAPSVGFMQPWSFIVLRSAELRSQVHRLFVKANAEAAAQFPEERRGLYTSLKLEGIMEAPINLCVTCDPNKAGPVVLGRTHIKAMDAYSTVCAVQNLWLAARAEGLGVGWVSILDNNELQRMLGIPDHILPVAYLCVGRVRNLYRKPELELAGWHRRLNIEEVVHFERWKGQDTQASLLDRLRDDMQAVGEQRFLSECLA